MQNPSIAKTKCKILKGLYLKYIAMSFLLWPTVSLRLNAQSEHLQCGNLYQNQLSQNKPDPNTSCGYQSSIFNSHFRDKSTFIPYNVTGSAPPTVRKKVKIRFMIANPQTATKKNFEQSDLAALQTMVTWLNGNFQNTQAPTKPQANVCGTCHIPDTRIQFELEGVTFFNSTIFSGYSSPNLSGNVLGGDSVLNIFFGYFDTAPFAGITNPLGNITKYEFYSDPNKDYIVLANVYQRYLNNDLWGATIMLQHELFHEYGLWHLWDGSETCNPADVDYLSDIFNVGGFAVCPQTGGFPNCNPTSPNYGNYTCNNDVMAIQGYTYTSPMQMGIIHRESFMGRMHRYSYPTEAPTIQPWLITSTQTWDFPIRMFQDIRVKRGKTLTIKCEVEMPKGSRIVVELGGKLIVDGGHITSYTQESTWKGIEVLGNKGLTSTEQNQGCVELINGAIIENAVEGIWNFSFENIGSQGGGGIIKASNSFFYNCFRAVGLSSYDVYNYGNNNCSFRNVGFTIDEKTPFISIYQNNQGNTFFTSFNIKSAVIIDNCIFKNEIPYNLLSQDKRAGAIGVLATAINITNSKFDDFAFGILSQAYSGIPTRNARIYDNSFNHITKNVTIAAQAYGDIRGNRVTNMINSPFTMIVGNFPVYSIIPGYGFYLDNTSNSYIGCQNYVNGETDMPNLENYKRLAVIAKNTTLAGSTIINNTFENIGIGFQTQGNNPKINNFCNHYNNNNLAWNINPQSGTILNHMNNQGTGCGSTQIRAGNRFTNNTRDIASYISVNNTWKYYAFYNATNNTQYPFNHSGSVNVTTCSSTSSNDGNSQCNKDWKYCLKVYTPSQISAYRAEYFQLKANGLKMSPDAEMLKVAIVEGYNDLEDISGLQSFLEEMNDDEAKKQLIPLYIETEQYNNIVQAIAQLSLNQIEKDAYTSYYDFLKTIQIEKRNFDSLSSSEIAFLESLAADSLEVSTYAKSILDWTSRLPWIHEVEQEPMSIMYASSSKFSKLISSKLYDATPNPTRNSTIIKVYVSENDIDKTPRLLIRNWTGKMIESVHLMKGDTYVNIDMNKYPSGIYFYSLYIDEALIDVKKLSVVK